jgi:hypothetical protein
MSKKVKRIGLSLIALKMAVISVLLMATEETTRAQPPVNAKGIYMTVNTFSGKRADGLIDALLKSGGNSIVVDVEHGGGVLAFRPANPTLALLNPGTDAIPNFKERIAALHQKGIYVIARDVAFKDDFMAKRKPEWRVKTKDGKLWQTTMGREFIDPSNPDVQDYNLMVIQELIDLGFDEIQLDYIRFPAAVSKWLDFHYDETLQTRSDIITDFLKRAKGLTQKAGIPLGIDVFGVTVWGDVDWKIVGQDIPALAQVVDVIYPMTYPSHFGNGFQGYYGHQNFPYKLIKDTVKKFVDDTHTGDPAAKKTAEIRPWIQGFPLNTYRFGTAYMNEQVIGSFVAGATGFMVWSPGNRYTYTWPIFATPADAQEL